MRWISQRRLVGLLDRLSDLGARPDDSRDERLRCGTLIFASVLIAVISVIWVATYLAFGYPWSAAIPAFYQLTTVVGLVVLARTGRFDVFRTTQLLVMLVLPALLQASLGGFVASSGMLLWAIFIPLAALALLGIRRSLPWLAASFVELAVLALLDPVLSRDPAVLPGGFVISFFVLNIMGVTVSAYVMLAYFVEQRARASRPGGGAGAVRAAPAQRATPADRRATEEGNRGDRRAVRRRERALRRPGRLHRARSRHGTRRAGGPARPGLLSVRPAR